MVRVISASNLSSGDYGMFITDRDVDGLSYDSSPLFDDDIDTTSVDIFSGAPRSRRRYSATKIMAGKQLASMEIRRKQ